MVIPKAIISDADGTIIDTLHVIRHGQYEALKTYLNQEKIDVDIPDYETYVVHLNQSVGAAAQDTLRRTAISLFPDRQDIFNGLDYEAIYNNILKPIQDDLAPQYVKAYDGLDDFLKLCAQKDIKFGIFTSGTPRNVVRNFGIAMPWLNLKDLFDDNSMSDIEKIGVFEQTVKKYYNLSDFIVVTAHDVTAHKPDPEALLLAMQRLDVSPIDCLVLGDHTVDMQSGVNADVPQIVGITHGFDDRKALENAGATNIVDSLTDLISQLS